MVAKRASARMSAFGHFEPLGSIQVYTCEGQLLPIAAGQISLDALKLGAGDGHYPSFAFTIGH
jgi:hypothetical protein